VQVTAEQITAVGVPNGTITEEGLRNNVSVALQYMNAWLLGNGAVAIFGLMEDTATAEISRSQIWQWIHHNAALVDGRPVTRELYAQIRDEELAKLGGRDEARFADAVTLLDQLALGDEFVDFLTYLAYDYLN
jgi:malate synthase